MRDMRTSERADARERFTTPRGPMPAESTGSSASRASRLTRAHAREVHTITG